VSQFVPDGFLPFREALARCAFHWGFGKPDGMSRGQAEVAIERAWPRLRPKLHSGEMPSYVLHHDGTPRLLTSDVPWTREKASQWGSSLNERAYRSGNISFPGIDGAWSRPALVKVADLEAFLAGTLSNLLERPQESSVLDSEPPSPTTPPSRSQPKREKARRILSELHPNGIPDKLELPDPDLLQQTKSRPELKGVSDDTILRAAGRRE